MTKKIFSFSGQGSQYSGMGKELYESNKSFRSWMDKADSCLYEESGVSMLERLYGANTSMRNALDDLQFSHPVLYAVQFATAMAVCEIIRPDYLLGASLGEFVAMAVAGVFSFEEGLHHVYAHAKCIIDHCPLGVMTAVLTTSEEIDVLLKSANVDYSFAVNTGSTNQTLAATADHWEVIEKLLKEKNILFQKLPVKYAFHSKGIQEAEIEFRWLSNKIRFERPQIPLISCATAANVNQIDASHLWDIVREPVYLQQALSNIIDIEEDILIDISPTFSTIGCVKSTFGNSSAMSKRAYKTLSPYKNSVQNLIDLSKAIS